MNITPATELYQRCAKLQSLMAAEGLDAVILIQNADLFYFTGTIQNGALYVPVQGEPLYLVRRERERARAESGLKEIVPYGSPKDLPVRLAEYGYAVPQRIGMELDVLPVGLYERYRAVFPDATYVDATPLVRRVRMIKSAYELELMRHAAGQIDLVCQRAAQVIREGMTELELAAELEYVARKAGHAGLIRMRVFNGEMLFGHTFSGTDSAIPAYTDTPLGGTGLYPAFGQGASFSRIGRNEPIVIDFAGSWHGYLADQTRIFSLGPLSDRLQRGYDDMLKVQERMKDVARPGVAWGALYAECLELALQMGYVDTFMGLPGAQVSFIGHGLGIEIDEFPFIARGFNEMLLEEGMVFAFEPKVVFKGEGAVGIENTFHLLSDGVEQLTCSSEELVVLS